MYEVLKIGLKIKISLKIPKLCCIIKLMNEKSNLVSRVIPPSCPNWRNIFIMLILITNFVQKKPERSLYKIMKNLKKILIAAMSIAAIAMSTTAFAATEATYNADTKTAALTLAEGDVTATSGQMTVVVVPKTFGADSGAADIYYINQEEFGTKFAEILANMGLKDAITPTEYEVRIGGENMASVAKFDFATASSNIMYGDADGNGIIEIDDSTIILRYKAGWSSVMDTINLANADADANGVVEIDDSTLILRYKAGWSSAILGPTK